MSGKEVLSEGELDALMDTVSGGDVPLDDGGPDGGCRLFDFSTREQALLAQMPALKTINEKHAMGLAQGIRELFKLPVEVEAGEVKLLKLAESLAAIPEPSAINTVRTLPLNGVSFLIAPGELTSFFVDQYFGGSSQGQHYQPTNNDLTPMERRMNEVLVTRFLLTLQSAWADKVPLNVELLGTETNPDFMQLGALDQLILCFSFGISVFDWQSKIDWIVPYAALEPLRSKLGSPSASAPSREGGTDWQAFFCNELPAVELELSAAVTSGAVSIAEVLRLREGAIIPLREPNEVTICVEGKPFCSGEHGSFNGKKSVKITRLFNTGD